MVEPETIMNKLPWVNNNESNKVNKRDGLSGFTSFASDRSNWDAIRHLISIPGGLNYTGYASIDNTAVSDVPTNCGIVTAMSCLALKDDSTNETKTGVCDFEK
jgi:hypothetical protein